MDLLDPKTRIVVFDCETTGLRAGVDRLHGLAIKWVDDPAPAPYYLLEELPGEWRAALEDPAVVKANQNVRFDVRFLRASGVNVQGPLFCTMLAQHCLNENRLLGLESLVEQHLGPGRLTGYEALLAELARLGLRHVGELCAADLADPARPYLPLLRRYGGEDVDNAAALVRALVKKHQDLARVLRERFGVARTPWDYLTEEVLPTEQVLADVELRGIRVRTEVIEEFRAKLAQEQGAVVQELNALVGAERRRVEENYLVPRSRARVKTEKARAARQPGLRRYGTAFLWSSNDHLARLLYHELGLGPHRTRAGSLSTDDAALLACLDEARTKGDDRARRVIHLLQRYREVSKNLTTYIGNKSRGLLSAIHGARFYPQYDARIVTGRLGSFAHTFPRDFGVTRALVPDDGDVFVYFDYAAIELRIAAHLSRDEEMLRWFNEGVDPHRATAARLFGVALDAVTDVQRQVGKRVNFLLIYKGSPGRLQAALKVEAGLEFSIEECQRFYDVFWEAHPTYKAHVARLLGFLREHQFVVAENGRIRRLPDIALGRGINWRTRTFQGTPEQVSLLGGGSPEELFAKARAAFNHAQKQALNFPIQTMGATLTKRACIEATRRGYRLYYTKHDCAVFGVPRAQLGTAIPELRKIAESSWAMRVPLVADFKILNSLYEKDRNVELERRYL